MRIITWVILELCVEPCYLLCIAFLITMCDFLLGLCLESSLTPNFPTLGLYRAPGQLLPYGELPADVLYHHGTCHCAGANAVAAPQTPGKAALYSLVSPVSALARIPCGLPEEIHEPTTGFCGRLGTQPPLRMEPLSCH